MNCLFLFSGDFLPGILHLPALVWFAWCLGLLSGHHPSNSLCLSAVSDLLFFYCCTFFLLYIFCFGGAHPAVAFHKSILEGRFFEAYLACLKCASHMTLGMLPNSPLCFSFPRCKMSNWAPFYGLCED